MNYSSNSLRTAVIKALKTTNTIEYPSGTVIPVYGTVPTNATFPFVDVEINGMFESDITKDSIGQTVTVAINITEKAKVGKGGFGGVDNMANQVTVILRNLNDYLNLSTDSFRIYKQDIISITPFKEAERDAVYYRNVILMEMSITETT